MWTLEALATICGTFLLAGFVKGVIGLGLPAVSLALLTAAFGLAPAMALMLVPSFVTNIWQGLVGGHLRPLLARLWSLLALAAATTWLGAKVLAGTDATALAALLGLLLALYALSNLLRWSLPPPGHREGWASPLVGAVVALGACGAHDSQSSAPVLAPCEPGAWVTSHIEIESAVYGGVDRVVVHRPPCTAEPVGVVYLLHGASADETQWLDVGAADAVEALDSGGYPVALVIPNVAAAYRCRRQCGDDVARYLLDDLEPVLVASGIDVDARAVGGISRGGRLALGAAAAAPGRFVAAGGHSPARVETTTVETLAVDQTPVWLDVGAQDSLAPEVALLAARLDSGARILVFQESPGGHDRTYWRAHTPAYLTWYVGELRRWCGDSCGSGRRASPR